MYPKQLYLILDQFFNFRSDLVEINFYQELINLMLDGEKRKAIELHAERLCELVTFTAALLLQSLDTLQQIYEETEDPLLEARVRDAIIQQVKA